MATKIQLRRDTAANWATINPVLSQGEPGLEIDTGKIKYGDGVSVWLNLAYSNGDAYKSADLSATGRPIGVREVSGVKSFTFQTVGHRFVDFVATSAVTNGNTLVINLAAYPDAKYIVDSWNEHNNIKIYVNDNQQGTTISQGIGDGSNVTSDGVNVTITFGSSTPTPLNYNIGDHIKVSAWVNGTQAVYADYISISGHPVITDTANTNTVVLDLSGDTSISIDGSPTVSGPNQLTAFPGKSYLVFNEYEAINDTRKIVNAVDVGSNIWQLTFDGAPRNVANSFVSLNANAAYNITGNTVLPIPISELPSFVDYFPDGKGYVSINGTPVANITYTDYHYAQYQQNIDYHGNWLIHLNASITCNTNDAITISFTKVDDVRVDYYIPNSQDYSSSYSNNAYQWFNWNTDLPFSVAERGNGVRSGSIKGFISLYRPLDKSSEWTPFNFDFDAEGNYNLYGVYRWANKNTGFNISGPNNLPDSQNVPVNRFIAGGGFGPNYGNDGSGHGDFVMWDFYEAGIFFKEAPWAFNYNYIAQDVKVDIAYKMTVFVSGVQDNWC